MVKLTVPYRSQWAADADDHSADCGPTCVAMILNFFDVDITPDGVYDYIPHKEKHEFTNFSELINAGAAKNVSLTRQKYDDQSAALSNLRANIDAGNPIIALISYKHWKEATGNHFDGGHFVVVTGYDDEHIYFHDPLFGLWVKPGEKGAHLGFSNADFTAGWGGFPVHENPNWACAVAGQVATAPAAPEPQPEPVPTPPPQTPTPPPATPTPVAPDLADGKMDDVNRRIRALAAYRWAVPPDFENRDDLQLWLDHLGDWGLEYDEYVVQGGDTLAALAARFYGQQHRWHAIQIYNDLGREGLWLGETLFIPRMGDSGAQEDPALPHDNTDFAKGLESLLLIDPELPAMDYNALAESTIGIGFMD